MTDPTPTDWDTLYTTVRQRFPDAPGLPDEFSFDLDDGVITEDLGCGAEHFHNDYAVLCIMLDWAMRFGAWWFDRGGANYFDVTDEGGYWSSSVESESTDMKREHHASHHAAYFAAVQAVVAQ